MNRHCINALAISTLLLLLQSCALAPVKSRADLFERDLTSTTGAVGEIHGAHHELNLYVFTYRNPKNFFDFIEVSLIAPTPQIAALLTGLRRHDRVRIKGNLLDNRSPQLHAELRSLEMVTRYASETPMPQYNYTANIPDDLRGKNSALFLVHAVQAGGRILVVEYKDGVLPIYVTLPQLTRDLARNDVVRLQYEVRTDPERPVHLRLREDEPRAVEVVDSVMALHGNPAVIEGALVLFPKSPQVRFNVFAVLQTLPDGLQRQYTLANFENEKTFEAIRMKLQKAWDSSSTPAVSGRNKLISTEVRVRATGKFNEIDPNQANAQIVLDSPDAVEILSNELKPAQEAAR